MNVKSMRTGLGLGALVAGLAVATGVAGVAGCFQKAPEVPVRTRLVVGLEPTFAPLGFRTESGDFVGYDVDLAREVGKRRGWEVQFLGIDWAAKDHLLQSGQIDCIWNGLTITDERMERMTFTPPYLRNEQVVLVHDDSRIHLLKQLKGKRVAVQVGSSSQLALDNLPELRRILKEVVECRSAEETLAKLEEGQVDAMVVDLLVANDIIQRASKPFRILEEGLAPEEYGVGFRLADKELADQVWRTLQDMAADGTVAQLSTQWFGSDISLIPVRYRPGHRR